MVQISKFLVGQKMQCFELENLPKKPKMPDRKPSTVFRVVRVFLDNLNTFLLVFFFSINLLVLPLRALKSTDMRSQPLCTSKHHC